MVLPSRMKRAIQAEFVLTPEEAWDLSRGFATAAANAMEDVTAE